jgi:hypothetical protein
VAVKVRMPLVVLSKQVLAVVVPVGGPHDAVDVLPRSLPPIHPRHVDGGLVVELDEDHRALNPVVEDAVRLRLSDPGEVRLVQVLPHLAHLHLRVAIPQVPDVLGDQVEQAVPLRGLQVRRAHAGVVEDDVVLECLGHVALALLRSVDDGFLRRASSSALTSASPLLCSRWSTNVPLCFPAVADTGSEPMKVGVITT